MTTETVEERSASDVAYAWVHDRILEGDFASGTMLSEASLAKATGVSRTPVRAALARLRDEGWIVTYPRRGALVRGLSDTEINEVAAARLALESFGASQATPEARQTLSEQLRPALDEQRGALERGDVRGFIELSIMFHQTFVEVSGNSVLFELNERLADRQRYLLFAQGDRLLARSSEVIAEHTQLVDALASGNATEFTTVLHAHITGVDGSPFPRLP